jgi:transposase
VAVSDDVSTGSSDVAPSIGRGDSHGPLSQWLHAEFTAAGFAVVLLEVRHVKAAISAMAVMTDRNDARGIAQLLRMGWYRPVHCKSQPSQDTRTLLTARKQLLVKAIDVELCLRGLLRGYGLKMGVTTAPRFATRARTHCRSSGARTSGRDDAQGARCAA